MANELATDLPDYQDQSYSLRKNGLDFSNIGKDSYLKNLEKTHYRVELSDNSYRYRPKTAEQLQVQSAQERYAGERLAGIAALGQVGLGALGFLEDRKTSKLQREGLKHDIATAKEQRANRTALGKSWNAGWVTPPKV